MAAVLSNRSCRAKTTTANLYSELFDGQGIKIAKNKENACEPELNGMLEQKSPHDNGDMDDSNRENVKTTPETATDNNSASESQDGPTHSSQDEDSNKDDQKSTKSYTKRSGVFNGMQKQRSYNNTGRRPSPNQRVSHQVDWQVSSQPWHTNARPRFAVYQQMNYQPQHTRQMYRNNGNRQSMPANEELSSTNIYIRGLPPNTTDTDLQNLCHRFGSITSTKAILDKDTNDCKGYGFVDFDSPTSAQAAIKNLTEDGVLAQMARLNSKPLEQDLTNLYLSNLPPTMAENDLDSMLRPFGNVISTRILKDDLGNSKGVGFARMDNTETCENVIKNFNGNYLPGNTQPLVCKFADTNTKKRLPHLNNQKVSNRPERKQWIRKNPENYQNYNEHNIIQNSNPMQPRNMVMSPNVTMATGQPAYMPSLGTPMPPYPVSYNWISPPAYIQMNQGPVQMAGSTGNALDQSGVAPVHQITPTQLTGQMGQLHISNTLNRNTLGP
ncbi:RNA-binding motif, single-stranded-interacting protein 1 [Trichoplax sp. H2]|nr:RNA-binding motif, single-stranded-interacting protein 1 [Trichoplax sp. H2]|eukprot:RDD36817.1 RNA-binding motif, single-stranded-interacting protein 1 [Trichoplax sp. H2]